MKIIWRMLAYLKFVFLPPLVGLVIWFLETIISTIARNIPRILSMIFFFCNENLGEENIVTQCANGAVHIAAFTHKLFYGLNGWFPVSFLLTTFVFCYTFRIKWTMIRFFLKAITFGKL